MTEGADAPVLGLVLDTPVINKLGKRLYLANWSWYIGTWISVPQIELWISVIKSLSGYSSRYQIPELDPILWFTRKWSYSDSVQF